MMCLATMAYVYTTCTVCVTIFSARGKFWPFSNFKELHTPISATRSYSLVSTDKWMFALLVLIGNLHLRVSLVPRPRGIRETYPDHVGGEKRTQATWEERNIPRPRGRRETYPGHLGGEKRTQTMWDKRNVPRSLGIRETYPGHVGEEKSTQTTWEERNIPRPCGRRETYPGH